MLAFAALAARLQALRGQPEAQVWALQHWLHVQPAGPGPGLAATGTACALRLLVDQPPPRVLMAHTLKALAQPHSGLAPTLFEACLKANGDDALEAFCLVLPDVPGDGVELLDWCDRQQPALAALPKAHRGEALLQALAAAPAASRLLMGELATGRWRSPMPPAAVHQAMAQALGISRVDAAWQLRPREALGDLLVRPAATPRPEAFTLPSAGTLPPSPDAEAWHVLPLPEGEWAQCGREDGDAWLWTVQGQLHQPFSCSLPPHSLLLGRWNGTTFSAVDLWRWAGCDWREARLGARWATLMQESAAHSGWQVAPPAATGAAKGNVWWRRWDAPVGLEHAGHLAQRARRELPARCVYLRTEAGQLWAALALAAVPGSKEPWVTVTQVEVPAQAAARRLLEQATQGPGAKRIGPVRNLVQPVQVRFSFDDAVPNARRKCGWEVRGARWEGVVEALFEEKVPDVATLGLA